MKRSTTVCTLVLSIFLIFLLAIIIYMPKKEAQRVTNEPIETKLIQFDKPYVPEIRVEVARTSEQHAKGLMFRQHLDENSGMLFIFQNPSKLTFWMKNTYLPLDIVFTDADRVINTIYEHTNPLDTSILYKSSENSQYAIELPSGFVDKYDLKIGDSFRFIEESVADISYTKV